MQNTGQNDTPPPLNPENHNNDQPKDIPIKHADSPGMRPSRAVKSVGEGIKIDTGGMTDEYQAGSDVPFVNDDEEAQFIGVNGGPSGQLHTPEEASKERTDALASVRDRVEIALRKFGKITKQSHTVDRLLMCLTPTASMSERLPFTPSASLHLASRNRDAHILHLAGLVIESWGLHMRYAVGGLGSVVELQSSITLLEEIVQDYRLFKVYPVDTRSSLFTLRRVTDQAKLNKAAEEAQAKRDARLGDFPSQ